MPFWPLVMKLVLEYYIYKNVDLGHVIAICKEVVMSLL
jgi:hypothetical protein